MIWILQRGKSSSDIQQALRQFMPLSAGSPFFSHALPSQPTGTTNQLDASLQRHTLGSVCAVAVSNNLTDCQAHAADQSTVFGIIADAVLALIPVPIISKMQLNLRSKLCLMVALGMGLM